MDNITISLIIPVYNVERYIGECLSSVVNQSDSFDEVILINDGSTDNSQFICEQYSSIYKNIKLINQKNRGPSIARNIGIQYASSNYIMFLDADDFLRFDTVKILKNYLQKKQYDALFFDAEVFIEDDCSYTVNKDGYNRKNLNIDNIEISGMSFFEISYPENYVASACMAVYHKEVIEKINLKFPEGIFYEDTYFSFVFTISAKQIVYIPENLYQRRYRNNSTMTSRYSEKKFRDQVKIGLLMWEKILDTQECYKLTYRKLFLEFVSDYFCLILDNFQMLKEYNEKIDNKTEYCLERMIRQYIVITDKLLLKDTVCDLSLLNKLLYNLDYIRFGKITFPTEYIKEIIVKIVNNLKNTYLKILRKLPLQKENYSIGIYGMGKHTEGLIAIYEKLIGEIKCDLVFIDSYDDNKIYKNRRVINYKRINNEFDLIIISSFLYEQEMIENVKRVNKTIPIYRFYEVLKKDIFSQYNSFLEYC